MKEQATLKGHDGYVSAVAFSPNGKVIASGSYDMTVKTWNGLACKEGATLKGHTDTVRAVAFSPVGNLLATGSRDGTVKLWDVSPNTKGEEGRRKCKGAGLFMRPFLPAAAGWKPAKRAQVHISSNNTAGLSLAIRN